MVILTATMAARRRKGLGAAVTALLVTGLVAVVALLGAAAFVAARGASL